MVNKLVTKDKVANMESARKPKDEDKKSEIEKMSGNEVNVCESEDTEK